MRTIPKKMRINILLADDHPVMRDLIRSILEREAGLRVVAEAADGQEAVQLARACIPDVVVMDVSMPVMDGISATSLITSEMPHTKVIGLSFNATAQYVSKMLSAGAAGYLLKESVAGRLVHAIRAVRQDRIYLEPKLARVMENYCRYSSLAHPGLCSLIPTCCQAP